jgi:hypothetical protein
LLLFNNSSLKKGKAYETYQNKGIGKELLTHIKQFPWRYQENWITNIMKLGVK